MTIIQHETAQHVSETTDYVETGCIALTVFYSADMEARIRKMLIGAIGRDCICEEGQPCPFAAGLVNLTDERRGEAKGATIPPLSVSVRDAARLTSLPELDIRKAINSGHLEAVKSGKRLAVKVSTLDAWLDSLPKAVPPS